MKLQFKLLALFVPLTILTLFISSTFLLVAMQKIMINEVLDNQQEKVKQIERSLSSSMIHYNTMLSFVSSVAAHHNSSEDEINHILAQSQVLLTTDPTIEEIVVLTADGPYTIRLNQDYPVIHFGSTPLATIIDTSQIGTLKTQYLSADTYSQESYLVYTTLPSQISIVLVTNLKEHLFSFVPRFQDLELYVVNEKREMVIQSATTPIPLKLNEQLQATQLSAQDTQFLNDEKRKELYVWTATDNGWYVAIVESTQDIYSSLKQLELFAFYILLIASLAAGMLALGISTRISTRVQNLTGVIQDMSQGKLDTEIDPKIKKSNDELGDLARAFERTLVSLKLAMDLVGKKKK